MESETAVLRPQLVEIIVDLHEHGGPNRKVGLVESDDPAVTDVFELEADIAGSVVELWKLEDSVRQIGERFPRSTVGEPREMTLADWFETVTNVGLLVEIIEGLRIVNSQESAYLGVFFEVDAIRMDANTVFSSDILAADYVKQLGESIDNTIRRGCHISSKNGQQADEGDVLYTQIGNCRRLCGISRSRRDAKSLGRVR
jgi:hypothetical protein